MRPLDRAERGLTLLATARRRQGHGAWSPVRNCARATSSATVPPKAPPPAMTARGTGIPPATDSKPVAGPTGTAASRMMAAQTARGGPGGRARCADGVEATGTGGAGRGGLLLLDTRPRFTDLKRRDNVLDWFRRPYLVRAAGVRKLRNWQSGKA